MRFLLSLLATAGLLAQTAHPAAPHQSASVQEGPLRAHLAFLADDLLEGRGTGQRGAELTVRYLETQMQSLGLSPAKGTSYRQPVSLLGLRTLVEQSTLSFLGGGASVTPKFGSEIVYDSGVAQAQQTFDAPVVFLGFGIDSPENRWDDFKGLDVHGKVLLVMVNEPAPTTQEPGLFDGPNLSAHGRWTTKFEVAARHGAAGILLIHTTPSASYGWQVVRTGWDAERFSLAKGPAGAPLRGWVTEATARALVKQGGQDLEALRAKAQRRDFQPVPLELRLQGTLRSAVRKVEQFNMAGVVPGTDAALKEELVIYSAHWDHLGMGAAPSVDAHPSAQPGSEPDTIYNGAVDNASGCAALLAMAQAAIHAPAKRSQMFLFVCAEGLLGSKAYAGEPLWPL
ncbi:MAG TPA: M28 family peptidase, partial [Geothrix sp.]